MNVNIYTMSLQSALSVYESLLKFKFDRRSSKPMEEYDLRKGNVHLEGEIRFHSVDKMQFERIYNTLLSYGFVKSKEEYQLKIIHYLNDNMSKIRCELNDLGQIREFCKTNVLPLETKYLLKQKLEEYPNYYENKDYQFRFSIQKEVSLDPSDKRIDEIQTNSRVSDKSFRYMTRITLTHPEMKDIQVDLSIVKSVKSRGDLIKEKTFSSSKLFSEEEIYEVELELVDLDSIHKHFARAKQSIQKTIKYIQCGIQNTSYPIPKKEQTEVLDEYLSLIFVTDKPKQIDTKNFIGPSSFTLQKINVVDDPDNQAPCIMKDFCVTEKADGERRLCLISRNGRIYMIDTNMKVQYTGCSTKKTELFATLIDGEFIPYGLQHKVLDLYAAFDLYFYNGKNTRREPFFSKTEKKNRYDRLRLVMKYLQDTIEYESEATVMKFRVKEFHMSDEATTMTECCQKLFHKIDTGVFEYENDGLIFTSMSLGVGMENAEDKVKNYKYTWSHSFKWKPPEFNTIDFLVQLKENHYISSTKTQNTEPYRLAHLNVGHDPKQGMLNPQELLFQGKVPSMHESTGYTKTLFIPSTPYDAQAYQAYLPLLENQGNLSPFTENKEVIEDDSIVEFKYVFTEDKRFRWVPLRVRYDKTADYRKTKRNFGNSYQVANSNWYSLYNPITKEMLCDASLLPGFKDLDQTVYYNRSGSKSYTINLRNFHNLIVKAMLYDSVMFKGCVLLDYAVGKGGDISKWMANNPAFVLGIDISKDNIHNIKDGVCARYLELKSRKRNLFDALYIQGDTSKLLRGEEFAVQEDKEEEQKSKFVFQQVMGIKEKSKQYGSYIESNYAVAKKLFDVGSIQFALHYMFKNKDTFHTFMKNCSDTIKVGGYFIGTCYDGAKIFEALKDEKEGGKIELYKSEDCKSSKNMKKIWSITKKYSQTELLDNETSLGLTVGVYQESINKDFDEYLVYFPYFIESMKQYGFEVELKMPGTSLPGVGNFSVLYDYMIKTGGTFLMCDKEKEISFMNKYFVFKKIRQVDSLLVYNGASVEEEEYFGKIGKAVKLNKPIKLRK
jgi:hypothetical protein